MITENNATLFIAAETDYAAYVNGKLAFFGSYKGYRDEKFYDELPLNDYLTEKENEIEIVVWYQGINCSSSISDGAGATSFWETVEGVEDGDLSCSLCHGWSALPIYYYAVTGRIRFAEE